MPDFIASTENILAKKPYDNDFKEVQEKESLVEDSNSNALSVVGKQNTDNESEQKQSKRVRVESAVKPLAV